MPVVRGPRQSVAVTAADKKIGRPEAPKEIVPPPEGRQARRREPDANRKLRRAEPDPRGPNPQPPPTALAPNLPSTPPAFHALPHAGRTADETGETGLYSLPS